MRAWEFIKGEGNARAFGVVTPILLAAVGGIWAIFSYTNDIPEGSTPEYSIYLESSVTPFVDGYVASASIPFSPIVKPSDGIDIWYLRRDQRFVPNSLDVYFEEISALNELDAIREIDAIPENELLHETILPSNFYEVMRAAGEMLEGSFQREVDLSDGKFPSLLGLFSTDFRRPESTAAYYMYRTKANARETNSPTSQEIIEEVNEVWSKIQSEGQGWNHDSLANALILNQFNPIFLVTISNTTEDTVIVSDIQLNAERLQSSASGMRSSLLEALDTVTVKLSGSADERISKKLTRPIKVPAGDVGSFRLILDSELMFIYKVDLSIFDGPRRLHQFSPFIVDYFSEL